MKSKKTYRFTIAAFIISFVIIGACMIFYPPQAFYQFSESERNFRLTMVVGAMSSVIAFMAYFLTSNYDEIIKRVPSPPLQAAYDLACMPVDELAGEFQEIVEVWWITNPNSNKKALANYLYNHHFDYIVGWMNGRRDEHKILKLK